MYFARGSIEYRKYIMSFLSQRPQLIHDPQQTYFFAFNQWFSIFYNYSLKLRPINLFWAAVFAIVPHWLKIKELILRENNTFTAHTILFYF